MALRWVRCCSKFQPGFWFSWVLWKIVGQKIGREITVSKNMCTVIAMHPIHNARDDLIVKRVSRAISVAQYLDCLAAAQRTSVERNTRLHGFFLVRGDRRDR